MSTYATTYKGHRVTVRASDDREARAKLAAKIRTRYIDGVVARRKARSTGTTVAVIDDTDGRGRIDADDAAWWTVCEDHGGVCSHTTRRRAEQFAACPEQWCPTCQEA